MFWSYLVVQTTKIIPKWWHILSYVAGFQYNHTFKTTFPRTFNVKGPLLQR